jgi:hypothetical protein
MTTLAKGYFAHMLPERQPTLRELAERAVTAAVAFNSYRGDDAEWDRRDHAALDASAAFHAALSDAGIDKPLLDALLNSGVVA